MGGASRGTPSKASEVRVVTRAGTTFPAPAVATAGSLNAGRSAGCRPCDRAGFSVPSSAAALQFPAEHPAVVPVAFLTALARGGLVSPRRAAAGWSVTMTLRAGQGRAPC